MKCSYEYQVRAQCPCDQGTDVYDFLIESESLILVEEIKAFFDEHAKKKEIFQEALTQLCCVSLGARVRSTGWHHGVKVTCQC